MRVFVYVYANTLADMNATHSEALLVLLLCETFICWFRLTARLRLRSRFWFSVGSGTVTGQVDMTSGYVSEQMICISTVRAL